MTFTERLLAIQRNKDSLVCVGLDPDPKFIPEILKRAFPTEKAIEFFLREIIVATAPSACAFKINFAFFEALGAKGWALLENIRGLIPEDTLLIADAKRGDIGNSASFYARSIFEQLQFDACTVAPYMGSDAIVPFLEYENKGVFVLARTSNPGATPVQYQQLAEGTYLYENMVRLILEWSDGLPGSPGLVVGATDLAALKQIRHIAPGVPFLIPGVGAQGGDPAAVLAAAYSQEDPIIVNSSRGILYASSDKDYAEAAGQAAIELQKTLQEARS